MASFSFFEGDTDILVASVPEGVTDVPDLPSDREYKSDKADAPFIYIGGTGPVTYRRCTADVSKQTPVTLAQLEAVIARIRPRCPPESDYTALDKFTKIPALHDMRAEAMRQCLTFVHMLAVNYSGCVACAVRACAQLRPERLFLFVDADADCDKHVSANRPVTVSGTWHPSTVHVEPRSYDRELILSGRQFVNTAAELAALVHVGAHPVIRHAVGTVVCNADLPKEKRSLDPSVMIQLNVAHRVTAYGVWIAERTVEEHKKKIEAESDPDPEPDAEEDLQAEEDDYLNSGRELDDDLETEMQMMTEQLEHAFPRTRKRTMPTPGKKRARDEEEETDAKEARTDA